MKYFANGVKMLSPRKSISQTGHDFFPFDCCFKLAVNLVS